MVKRLNAKQLRKSQPTKKQIEAVTRNPIYLVLDRVIDTYNIGSLFRLADAVAIKKVFICGEVEYPPSSRIHKAAVGTEEWVPWEKVDSAAEVIDELKQKGVTIVAVEQNPNSTDYSDFSPKFPVAVVVGNETEGVSPEVLERADVVVELPMFGINRSFNVWGSAAVVLYKIIESLKKV